jgi:hypothetical protein
MSLLPREKMPRARLKQFLCSVPFNSQEGIKKWEKDIVLVLAWAVITKYLH